MDRGPPREEPLSLCISAHTARAYKAIKWLIPGPPGPFPDVVATGASLLTLPVPITQQVRGSNHSATVPIAFQSPQQAHWRADRQRSGLVGQEVVSEAPALTAGPDHALEEAAPADSSRLGRPVTESWGWAPPQMPERPLSTLTLQATDRLPSRLLPPMAKPPTCQRVSPGCGQCFIMGLLPNRLPNRATCGNEGRTPAPALGGVLPADNKTHTPPQGLPPDFVLQHLGPPQERSQVGTAWPALFLEPNGPDLAHLNQRPSFSTLLHALCPTPAFCPP